VNRLALFVLLTVAVLGCSSGGHSNDPGTVTALAPTVTLDCGVPPASVCPEMVDCRPYLDHHGKPVSVDARWRERLDLCCGLRLCDVDGECRYGCPESLRSPACR
jgi:hypothetical protein